jgi:hypothetical protein
MISFPLQFTEMWGLSQWRNSLQTIVYLGDDYVSSTIYRNVDPCTMACNIMYPLCTDDETVVIDQTDHRVLLPTVINFTCQFLWGGICVETENWHQCIHKKSISIGPSCNPLMSMLLSLTIIGHYLFAMYASSLCCEWSPFEYAEKCQEHASWCPREMADSCPQLQDKWDLAAYQFWFFVLSTPQACTKYKTFSIFVSLFFLSFQISFNTKIKPCSYPITTLVTTMHSGLKHLV